MKDPVEVLRMKQKEIDKVKKEIQALRTVAGILQDEPEPFPKKLAKVVQLP
jgi:ABC-type phosphate transport system ATPase subunit